VFHVLNRGNARRTIFRKARDYQAFVQLLREARLRFPDVRLLGYCLMPNHFHLVLWPTRDGELSLFMRWLTNAHVRRYHQHYHSYGQGHIYQGRFKSFLVQEDAHLLALLRYVESNPLRVRRKLADRAEQWPWSSLRDWERELQSGLLCHWPVDRPGDWSRRVNQTLPAATMAAVTLSLARNRPFGDDRWVQQTAKRLGLLWTLRPRGRPRRQ
jgi:putative transposase